jgi:beta-glucosidase
MKRIAGLSAIAAAAGGLPRGSRGEDRPPYKDPSQPVESRVKDLMSRMTLEEKVAQMVALWFTKSGILEDGSADFSPEKASRAYPYGFGHLTRPSDRRGAPTIEGTRWRTSDETVKLVNDVQHWAMTQTRLGIPVLCHEECLHGYMAPDATMFPVPIALAGCFDLALAREVAVVIAREMRAHGSHLALSPVVDIARDPRWGRIEETWGEDPYLCSEMGVASVLGLQGEGRALGAGKVFATLKHMTGHGQPQAGENVGPAPIGEHELRASFFPPFREIVARTGVSSVMPSYNEIDGIASHANKWLLGGVLRGEWHFGGAVVSDYNAVEQLQTLHHVVPDLAGAAVKAVEAGVDVEFPDGAAFRGLPALVRAGRVPESAIDAACARVLSLKFRAGLFEDPYADAARAKSLAGNDEARALALKAARKSICLLKNDGTLPLASKVKRIALIGPNSHIARLGGYSAKPRHAISLLEALRAKLAGKVQIVHAQGVFITQSEEREADAVLLADPARNRALIDEAVGAARDVDAIVVAIGDTEQTSREGYSPNHLGDRQSLDLLGEQNALVDALRALGKPLVVVAINGRPPSYPNAAAKASAMLECWYVGQEGATAIAEALVGELNPGAKLPVTVARDVSQVPIYYNAHPAARVSGSREPEPLFPFGFGLSYTTFELSAPRLSASRISAGNGVTVEVDVRNTGARTGDEVVQVYVRQRVASIVRPARQLCGFSRVTLAPGERRTVSVAIRGQAFSLWNREMKEVVEPGLYDILAGPDSRNLKGTVLEIA